MEKKDPSKELDRERLTPADLIKKHIDDPHHEVTDDDIRNLNVGENVAEEKVKKESEKKETEIKDLPGNDSLPNPYSIMGS